MKIMVAFLSKKNKKKKLIKKTEMINRSIDTINIDKLIQKNKINKNQFKYNQFNKLNIKNNQIKFTNYITVLFFTLFFCYYIKDNRSVLNTIYSLSNNNRNTKKYEFNIADITSKLSIYNEKNYIIKNNENNKVIKADNKDNSNMSEINVIDSVVNIDEVEAFIKNEKPKAVITENTPRLQRINVGTSKLLNYSSKRNIDFEKLLNSNINLTKKNDNIMLYNTHTSESYTNSENYKFNYSGTMRSTDGKYNMIAITKEFSDNLKEKGFNVYQDTTPHDYGCYTTSYSNSRKTLKKNLAKFGRAGICIDVHRDATADLTYGPKYNIKGVTTSKLMLVIGVGTNNLKNEYWEDNLRLAIKLQNLADKVYPGLFRPMIIRNSIYNQDLNKFSILVEVGATGNTIEEAKLATRCMTNLLNIMYKD